ncbi:hypothetical protein TVAG_304720 [Trichomonas vaginalis G3]|uniref:Uncharacterized protein n=1 Tax=Trichomonas vaginalis (strain ATCC PRA-98 / G3) TaxID=412133 RepID=A2F2Q7_TRIV3|nr:hypothetical protein TVAGG3_1020290 [Trichomonas vaginalis G3]EAY00831.1 hypothetical protein TVAG_304720 [Trichomonas vaginalis G3]KAI5492087.1 hypothetical protein TVAGG3_1020290 [Trichomonas vaginalis G3]|eukprot:XP_001313760.1 hypothetical protein [Trichomonas vaginalis G3]
MKQVKFVPHQSQWTDEEFQAMVEDVENDIDGDHEIKRKLARKEYKMDWLPPPPPPLPVPQVNKPFTFPRIPTFKFKFE